MKQLVRTVFVFGLVVCAPIASGQDPGHEDQHPHGPGLNRVARSPGGGGSGGWFEALSLSGREDWPPHGQGGIPGLNRVARSPDAGAGGGSIPPIGGGVGKPGLNRVARSPGGGGGGGWIPPFGGGGGNGLNRVARSPGGGGGGGGWVEALSPGGSGSGDK